MSKSTPNARVVSVQINAKCAFGIWRVSFLYPKSRNQRYECYIAFPGYECRLGIPRLREKVYYIVEIELLFFRNFNRQIQPVSPLFPRPDVVADLRITDKPQRQIGLGRAVAALSVTHDLLFGCDPCSFIHLPKLISGFEGTTIVKIVEPFYMYRTWNCTCTFCTCDSSVMFIICPCI